MSSKPGRVLNGRYRLIRTVGVGSQASVWVAEHLALSTQVAVKLIDPDLSKRPDARERFKREATAAAQLRSPHVVQILDHGIDQGPEGDQPFIVMELLEGEDLFQRLEKRHHLSLRDTSKIMTQIARALTRAHAAGIVHRDLKPENIFLTHNDDDEIVKVLDFGVAKVRDAAKVTMQKTGVGTLIGTPHYMSPEQVKGIGEVDYRTDIWAFGVLAFQCVTGDLPFDSEGVGDLLIKITIGDMPVPSKMMNGLPPAFDAWFARACDRDPARRFASARAAAEGLARIAGLGAGTGPTTVPRPGASIPPPADPTKRPSEAPPPPKASKPAAPPPKVEKPEEELDDDDWEEAEPAVSVTPPPEEEVPAAAPPRPPKPPSGLAAAAPAPPPSAATPPPARPIVDEASLLPPDESGPVNPFTESASAPVAAPNPFLVNDFVPARGAPPAPPSSAGAVRPPAPPSSAGGARPAPPSAGAVPPSPASQPYTSQPRAPQPYVAPPPPSTMRSTVSGVESPDLDDDEELAFGKNRRKKLVRWLTIGLVVLAAGVTWMVVSSQLRARDPEPDPATAQPVPSTPTVPPAFDPAPATTSTDTSSATTSSTAVTKPTAKPRPTGGVAPGPVRPGPAKKPNDGSVEIPTPDDLPPPAP